jgi:hypothetical protein
VSLSIFRAQLLRDNIHILCLRVEIIDIFEMVGGKFVCIMISEPAELFPQIYLQK